MDHIVNGVTKSQIQLSDFPFQESLYCIIIIFFLLLYDVPLYSCPTVYLTSSILEDIYFQNFEI